MIIMVCAADTVMHWQRAMPYVQQVTAIVAPSCSTHAHAALVDSHSMCVHLPAEQTDHTAENLAPFDSSSADLRLSLAGIQVRDSIPRHTLAQYVMLN